MKKLFILFLFSLLPLSGCFSQFESAYSDNKEYIIDEKTGDTVVVYNHYSYIESPRYFGTYGYWYNWNYRPHRHFFYNEPRYIYRPPVRIIPRGPIYRDSGRHFYTRPQNNSFHNREPLHNNRNGERRNENSHGRPGNRR